MMTSKPDPRTHLYEAFREKIMRECPSFKKSAKAQNKLASMLTGAEEEDGNGGMIVREYTAQEWERIVDHAHTMAEKLETELETRMANFWKDYERRRLKYFGS